MPPQKTPVSYARIPEKYRGLSTKQLKSRRRKKAAALIVGSVMVGALAADQGIKNSISMVQKIQGQRLEKTYSKAIREARAARNLSPNQRLHRGYTMEYDTKVTPETKNRWNQLKKDSMRVSNVRSAWEKNRGKIAGGAAVAAAGAVAVGMAIRRRRRKH